MADAPNEFEGYWGKEHYPGQPQYAGFGGYPGQPQYNDQLQVPGQGTYPDQTQNIYSGQVQPGAQQYQGELQYANQPLYDGQIGYATLPDQQANATSQGYPGQPEYPGQPQQQNQSLYPGQPQDVGQFYPGQPQNTGQLNNYGVDGQSFYQSNGQQLNQEYSGQYGYQNNGSAYQPFESPNFQSDFQDDTEEAKSNAPIAFVVLSIVAAVIGIIVTMFSNYPGFIWANILGATSVAFGALALGSYFKTPIAGKVLAVIGIIVGSLSIALSLYAASRPFVALQSYTESINGIADILENGIPDSLKSEVSPSVTAPADQQDKADQSNKGSSDTSSTSGSHIYGLGQPFTFDGLEFTFDTEYSFVVLENQYSNKNGSTVIKLGANIKNISDDKNQMNLFHYDIFGSQGQELESASAYFDEAADFAGDLKPGASYHKYFYIPYDGNGKYSLDFSDYTDEVSVEFDVTQ